MNIAPCSPAGITPASSFSAGERCLQKNWKAFSRLHRRRSLEIDGRPRCCVQSGLTRFVKQNTIWQPLELVLMRCQIMKKILPLLLLLVVSTDAFARPVTEPPGPSSRRTPITFSEIMYKPAKRADARNLEFVELYNSNPWAEDISDYSLNGQVQFTFPSSTTIPGQSYIVIAAAPADMTAVYGLANVFGPYAGSLKTSGEIKLYDEQNLLLLDVDYDNIAPWPMGADGTGHSIVLARPSYGEGDARAWERSELPGGSPGAAEVLQTNALRNVVINEILAHTD